MQSNPTPTPPAPQPAPPQRKPLVLFSCCCKLSELMQLAKKLQEVNDDAQVELVGQAPTLHPVAV